MQYAYLSITFFKAAHEIILEVRRQFNEIPGLRDGDAEPDSDRCVSISTQSAIHEMILPGLYAVFSPMAVGFLVGPRCLTGMLGGAISSGMMLAIMMSNSGGAWDNAKKYVEIEQVHGGKHTPVHVACVVGDTVGDPFKDTSGPVSSRWNNLVVNTIIHSPSMSMAMFGFDGHSLSIFLSSS